jgi:DnaJ-class molecular chaperone
MKKHAILLPTILFLFSCAGNKQEEKSAEIKDSIQAGVESPMSPEEMEMKEMAERQKNEAPKESPYKDAKIDIRVFENKEAQLKGFGYDILIEDAMYVHQPHIPAINGNRGFKTKEQAHTTAEFVIYKIRNNIMPPSLSVEELDSLGTLK